MNRRFKPPVYAVTKKGTTHWVINLGDDERAVVVQMLGELRDLLMSDDPVGVGDVGDLGDDAGRSALLQRLFPPAFLDDEEKEAEYQRLMRDELVASRLAQINTVTATLAPDGPTELDEEQVIAVMQSINAVRVVLGTMLDVGEDDDEPDDDTDVTPEHQLYVFLSWLLDWTVRSLSGA